MNSRTGPVSSRAACSRNAFTTSVSTARSTSVRFIALVPFVVVARLDRQRPGHCGRPYTLGNGSWDFL